MYFYSLRDLQREKKTLGFHGNITHVLDSSSKFAYLNIIKLSYKIIKLVEISDWCKNSNYYKNTSSVNNCRKRNKDHGTKVVVIVSTYLLRFSSSFPLPINPPPNCKPPPKKKKKKHTEALQILICEEA